MTAPHPSGPAVTVRPVRPAEHRATGELVVAAYDAIGWISDGYRRELLDTAARVDAHSSVLVAVPTVAAAATGPLGTVTIVDAASTHFEHAGHGDGGFRALAVAPVAQARGIAGRLLDDVVASARTAGWRRITISTMAWMHGAQRLYARRGFVRRPDLDVRYPSGVGLAYSLDLVPDAAAAFPAPGPVPGQPPWHADVHMPPCG